MWLALLAGIFMLAGCSAPVAAPAAENKTTDMATDMAADSLQGELVVFAAASLIDAFTDMEAAFSAAHPHTQVIYSFAGSQQLAQQLAQGAQADLFAAANARQMANAVAAGRVAEDSATIFARNQLVVIVPVDNPAGIEGLEDLARPGIKLVLAAQEVPVGAYALDFLAKASVEAALGVDYEGAVLANVVSYEQNVRAVLSKVMLGEADAGIVYSSDVGRDAAEAVQRIDIPPALNTIAAYPIAPVVDSEQPASAAAFIDFVLSEAGQSILAQHGFLPLDAAP